MQATTCAEESLVRTAVWPAAPEGRRVPAGLREHRALLADGERHLLAGLEGCVSVRHSPARLSSRTHS